MKMKKLMTVALVVMMLLGLMVPAFAAGENKWVNCADGKTLNLRVEPSKRARAIGHLECGTKVEVLDTSNPVENWTCVRVNGKDGWVMSKFLVDSKPGKYEITERDDNFIAVTPYNVVARALNSKTERSVGLRVSPNKTARSIRRLAAGDVLQVVASGRTWSKVVDPMTGRTGYVANDYMVRQ